MKQQIFKTAKKILPFAGLMLLMIYIFFYLELDHPEKLKQAQDYIITILTSIFFPIAILLTVPRIIVRNCAWQIVLKEQGIKISFWQSLKVFLIGYFYGTFTPGYYGQLIRIPYLKEKTGEPYGKLFVNTFIEINMRGFSIYLMVVTGAILVLTEYSYIPEIAFLRYIIFLWFTLFCLVMLYFIGKERGEKVFFALIKFIIPRKFKKNLNSFVSTFYKDFPKLRVLILPIILSTVTWIIIFTQEYLIVLSLGVNIDYLVFLLVFPIANIAGFIPISIAGLGVREAVAIFIFPLLYADVTGIQIFTIAIIGFMVTDAITGLVGFSLSLTETVDKKSFLKHLKHG